jgi:hypothetical protein
MGINEGTSHINNSVSMGMKECTSHIKLLVSMGINEWTSQSSLITKWAKKKGIHEKVWKLGSTKA